MQQETMALCNTSFDKKMYCHTSVDTKIIWKVLTKPTELPALNHE
jgi:hypothetical protein